LVQGSANSTTRCGIVALAALLIFSCRAEASKVLILWDEDNESVTQHPPDPSELGPGTQALYHALVDEGHWVVLSNTSQHLYTGNNPPPAGFDVIIHLNGNTTSTLNVMKIGAVVKLLDHVQNQRGSIITSENTEAQMEIPFVGLTRKMEELMCLDRDVGAPPPYGEVTVTVVPEFQFHPLMRNLPATFSFTGTHMNSLLRSYEEFPARVVLNDENGRPVMAYRSFTAGRALTFSHAGNFRAQGQLSTTLLDPNALQLYKNAVWWLDRTLPAVASFAKAGPTPGSATSTAYRLTFTEPVTGVDPGDFTLELTQGFVGTPQVVVTPVTSYEYDITFANLAGSGSLVLRLVSDNSIRDVSFNTHAIATGATGPAYLVDATRPRLKKFTAAPTVFPTGGDGQLTLEFDEVMNTSVFPVVRLATADNGDIFASGAGQGGRVSAGILAQYVFGGLVGTLVPDVSGVAPALDLSIGNAGAVSNVPGGLRLNTPVLIASAGAATKIINAISAAGELTVEAWLRPASASQGGPARILTLSDSTAARNLTLEQDGGSYAVRLRTTTTNDNGEPGLKSSGGVVAQEVQHVVFTRGVFGGTVLYLDGEAVANGVSGGDLSSWTGSFRLGLGNEFSNNRPWLGDLYLAAVYARRLSAQEVQQNYHAGPTPAPSDGTWIGSFTYRVSLDRSVLPDDAGPAQVFISGARDQAGNVMLADSTNSVPLVGGALAFSAQPAAYTRVEAGATLTLSVAVSGAAGPVNYEWFHDGGGKAFAPVGPNAPELVIDDVGFDDAGIYYCVVTDNLSVVQSNSAVVEVVGELPAPSVAAAFAALLAAAHLGLRRWKRRR
jgi:hypothetical protein